MRPSNRPTGEVWRVLSEWAAAHPLHPNQTQMAGLFGVSNSLMSNWKYMQSRMQSDDMVVIAQKTGIAIDDLSRAAVADLPTVLKHIAERRGEVIDIPGQLDEALDALEHEADAPPPIAGRSVAEAARREDQAPGEDS